MSLEISLRYLPSSENNSVLPTISLPRITEEFHNFFSFFSSVPQNIANVANENIPLDGGRLDEQDEEVKEEERGNGADSVLRMMTVAMARSKKRCGDS